ncbi:MAG: glycosyltransferase [Blastochloris sp.]|nr:glycosyltransferase [Blastochloris sp.]
MACGAPVLGANFTSIPEIINWSEALFDPRNLEQMQGVIHRALVDETFREELVERGLTRAGQFRWEDCASRAWDAFETLLEGTGKGSLLDSKKGIYLAGKEILGLASEVDEVGVALIPKPWKVGDVFKEGGLRKLVPYLGPGWSSIEPSRIWSDESEAGLTFQIEDEVGTGCVLELNVEAFVNWKHPWIDVSFFLNENKISQQVYYLFSTIKKVRIPIPRQSVGKLHSLRIRIKNPVSPRELKISSDARRLGLALRSIEVMEQKSENDLHLCCHRHLLGMGGKISRWWSQLPWKESWRSSLRKHGRKRMCMGSFISRTSGEKRRISVVINTLNRADLLEQTLKSLGWQRHRNFEVIVVNGPSRDGTTEVLERWQGRIKVGDCPEANLSMSRNIGICMAAGEVVAFLDDDAVPEPEQGDALHQIRRVLLPSSC